MSPASLFPDGFAHCVEQRLRHPQAALERILHLIPHGVIAQRSMFHEVDAAYACRDSSFTFLLDRAAPIRFELHETSGRVDGIWKGSRTHITDGKVPSRPEQAFHVLSKQHQVQVIRWRGLETPMLIEVGGARIFTWTSITRTPALRPTPSNVRRTHRQKTFAQALVLM